MLQYQENGLLAMKNGRGPFGGKVIIEDGGQKTEHQIMVGRVGNPEDCDHIDAENAVKCRSMSPWQAWVWFTSSPDAAETMGSVLGSLGVFSREQMEELGFFLEE